MKPPGCPDGPVLRVMSFNLRRDADADGPHRWAMRREAAVRLVQAQAPHVLGTQEGLPHQLADLDARLPDYARVGGDRRGDGTDEACAIYYDTRRLCPVAWGDLWLSSRPGEAGSRTWGNRLPRIVTWARLLDAATGAAFTVANTHLDHESARARLLAARFLASRLPHAVLMGDFNALPGDPVHRELLRAGWRDAHPEGPATFHGFTGAARQRLDWVLVPAGVELHAASVPMDPVAGRFPSDHHPVVADLVLPQAAQARARA